jgi:uncharacterized RDD family membrane protein YckC
MSDQSDPPTWGSPPPGDQGGTPPPPPPPPGYGPPAGQGYSDPYAGQQTDPYAGQQADPYAGQAQGGLGYATWFQRVGAYLVDALLLLPAYVLVFIGIAVGTSGATTTTDPTTGAVSTEGGNPVGFVIIGLGYLVMFGILIWNQYVRQGRTGWSIGKQVLGIRLLKEDTGQPMGAGMCFVRSIVHIVDALPCYIGFLWPLWDAKRQTFADKIMTTVVVQQRKA